MIKQAVILAAGESSRFQPLSAYRHKAEIPLLGKSLLQRTVDNLQSIGVEEVIIVHSPDRRPQLFAHECELRFVVLDKPTGMGDALLAALDFLDDKYFVLHPYHFAGVNYMKEMIKVIAENDGCLLVTDPVVGKSGGLATVEKDDIVQVEEMEYKGGDNMKYVLGIYLLTKAYTDILQQTKKDHYSFELALNQYAGQNKLSWFQVRDYSVSLKYPWDLFKIKDTLLRSSKASTAKTAKIDPTAVIDGVVIIDENAKIGAYAVIRGPAYIGRNVRVGDHALVRDLTTLEEGSMVGGSAEIKNSIVLEEAHVQGYLADSIVGQEVRIAHGFVSANRRIDRETISVEVKGKKINTKFFALGCIVGDNVYTGINVATMPGVKIGENSVIGPRTTVFANVPPSVRYYQKAESHTEKIIKK